MKSILKIIFSISILSFYSSANADTIKWLHLFGDDDLSMPKMLQAVKEFEDKTGHTVELQYLENESFKANIKPSEPLELCGIAKLSIPSSLNLSIHCHKPSGSFELALLYGTDGMRLPFPLKTTFL